MKHIFIYLCTIVFSVCLVAFDKDINLIGYSKAPMSPEEIQKEVSLEHLWITFPLGRSIYTSKIDGSDRVALLENFGFENSIIFGFKVSQNGKSFLITTFSSKGYSLWVTDLDKNQPILLDNNNAHIQTGTGISGDGEVVVYMVGSRTCYCYIRSKNMKIKLGDSDPSHLFLGPAVSPDGSKVAFICFKKIGAEKVQTLWVRDVKTGIETEVSSKQNGSFRNPIFSDDSKKIILPCMLPDKVDFSTLFEYDLDSKKFTKIVSLGANDTGSLSFERYNILGGEVSRKNSVYSIVCPNKGFYSYREGKVIKLDKNNFGMSGWYRTSITYDGKYLLFGTSDSIQFIARTDGLFTIELDKIAKDTKVSLCRWFNHPPFPPILSIQAKNTQRILTWSPANQGTYPIQSYNIYKRKAQETEYTKLPTLSSLACEHIELDNLPGENCYYRVSALDEYGYESTPSNEVLMDNVFPQITLTSPSPLTWFSSPQVQINGKAYDADSGIDKVLINGMPAILSADGSFTLNYTLMTEGENLLTATAFDKFGNQSQTMLTLKLDTLAPQITLLSPGLEAFTNSKVIEVKFSVTHQGSNPKKVSVNEYSLPISSTGEYSYDLQLTEGRNEIILTSEDAVGNQSELTSYVDLDSIPPNIDLTFPQDNTELYAIGTNARGKVTDAGSGVKSLTINTQSIPVNPNGTFQCPIQIHSGANTFTFISTDLAGNQIQKVILIKGVQQIIVKLTIGSSTIIVNERESTIDAPPFVHDISKRTLVPARFVVEPIGGNITFDPAEQKVTILRESNKIELWIGKNQAMVSGKKVPIDSSPSLTPMIVNGRTYLPLRFVSENVGFKVEWDPKKHLIRLEFPDTMKKK